VVNGRPLNDTIFPNLEELYFFALTGQG